MTAWRDGWVEFMIVGYRWVEYCMYVRSEHPVRRLQSSAWYRNTPPATSARAAIQAIRCCAVVRRRIGCCGNDVVVKDFVNSDSEGACTVTDDKGQGANECLVVKIQSIPQTPHAAPPAPPCNKNTRSKNKTYTRAPTMRSGQEHARQSRWEGGKPSLPTNIRCTIEVGRTKQAQPRNSTLYLSHFLFRPKGFHHVTPPSKLLRSPIPQVSLSAPHPATKDERLT